MHLQSSKNDDNELSILLESPVLPESNIFLQEHEPCLVTMIGTTTIDFSISLLISTDFFTIPQPKPLQEGMRWSNPATNRHNHSARSYEGFQIS